MSERGALRRVSGAHGGERCANAASSRLVTRRAFAKGLAGSMACLVAGDVLAGCAAVDEFFTGKHTLVDSTGRRVDMPTPPNLTKVYFTSPLAQIFCFTMAPDLMAGTTMRFSQNQLEFLPVECKDLTLMGTLSGGGVIDTEALRHSGVQLIFSISGVGLTDVNVADALGLEEQSGIPVFLIDGSFECIGDTYRMLGECLGRAERAEELAAYCQRIYDDVTEAVSRVPAAERVRYYFAEGPEGLATESSSSQHSLAFLVAGGENVASEVKAHDGEDELIGVSIDQVREWNPEVIVAWDHVAQNSPASVIRASSGWQDIDAVRNGRVYTMPTVPFPFCDRPPGVNRFLGIQWFANLLYPRYYDIDMVEAVREFCSVCYWRDISRSQAQSILATD